MLGIRGLPSVLIASIPNPPPEPIFFVLVNNDPNAGVFGKSQIIHIVIDDPDISDTDEAKGEPDVAVNDKTIRMIQAVDGKWYAFVADRTQSQIEDQKFIDSSGIQGHDFGIFCSNDQTVLGIFTDKTAGVALPGVTGGSDGIEMLGPECFPATSPSDASMKNVILDAATPTQHTPQIPLGQIGI